MKEIMPDISFERSMNHNYLILSKCDFFDMKGNDGGDYRTRMLLENRIPGLLPVSYRQVNGEGRYYYEINSLQSFDRLYDKSAIRYDELRRLLSGCVSLFERLEEYLLDGTQIVINPQFIYIDVEKMEPNFVCYPDYKGDVRLSFMEFVEGLLTKIDHTDECAVMLGYQVYRYTRNPNYVMGEIGRMAEHVMINMVQKGEKPEECAVQKGLPKWERTADNYAAQPVGFQAGQRMEDYGTYQCGYDESNNCRDDYDESKENEKTDKEKVDKEKTKNVGDLVGGIFCVFVSLCAGAIVLGARLIKSVELSENNELYLFGAVGMASMAAVLFFSCYFKKRKYDKEREGLDDDYCEQDYAYCIQPSRTKADLDNTGKCEGDSYYIGVQSDLPEHTHLYMQKNIYGNSHRDSCPKTVCLGDGVVEERVLYGRMEGKEINVSLDRLPMTVGKLANMVDFVINDTAVSKMHARFEEHDGRVYVCDLNSTNGTVRNGVLLGVNQSVKLEPGDRIRFGRTCFTYC